MKNRRHRRGPGYRGSRHGFNGSACPEATTGTRTGEVDGCDIEPTAGDCARCCSPVDTGVGCPGNFGIELLRGIQQNALRRRRNAHFDLRGRRWRRRSTAAAACIRHNGDHNQRTNKHPEQVGAGRNQVENRSTGAHRDLRLQCGDNADGKWSEKGPTWVGT